MVIATSETARHEKSMKTTDLLNYARAPASSFDASGDGSTITGNLALTATSSTLAMFQSTTLTEVKGNITIKGGWFDDTFETNGFFRANKNVSLTLAGGDNRVTIGDGSAQASITGNLSIKTGAGNDTIALNRLTLSGTAKIATLAGKDELSIEMGSTFVMAFTADMGTGDDVIAIAQNVGSASPVQFNGSVKILAGVGNDLLFLGLNPGDSGTQALFNAAVDLIDGGLGIDTFGSLSSNFTGVTPVNFE